MATPKRFTRSRDKKMFAGVCGGIAEYFNIDVALVRLGYVVVSVFSAAFPGLLVYIIAVLVVPEED